MANISEQKFQELVRRDVLSKKNFNKIFCIGFNKTGTTTIEKILRLYGYSMPVQQEQEVHLTRNVLRTDYRSLSDFCRMYDAFQDLPFSLGATYIAADALFPDSKFILTTRDSTAWFASLKRAHQMRYTTSIDEFDRQKLREEASYLYAGYEEMVHEHYLTHYDGDERITDWSQLYDEEYYKAMFQARNDEIRKYFSATNDKLLVLDISREGSTERICKFLNIDLKYAIKMPHTNRSTDS